MSEQKPVTPFDMFKAVAKTALGSTTEFVPVEISEARFAICKGCPMLREQAEIPWPKNSCRECNCFMPAKTKLPGAFCPIGKWGVVASNS